MNLSPKAPLSRRPPASGRRPPVNTYYRAKANTNNSSPFQKRAAPRKVRRYFFGLLDIILILLILAGLGYSLVISPKPQILVSSQAFHSLGDYRAVADQQFSRVKNRNKITYDERSITIAMEKKFPEISSISTELPIFSERPTLRITVSPASLKVKNDGRDYIVDSRGIIVGLASQLPAASGLPQIIDQSGYPARAGQPLLNVGSVDFIKTINAEIKAAKVPVSTMTLPPVVQELDLRTSDQTYYVKFFLGGDALTQVGQYLAARNHFNQTGQKPSQYIDVRIAGKIFYK